MFIINKITSVFAGFQFATKLAIMLMPSFVAFLAIVAWGYYSSTVSENINNKLNEAAYLHSNAMRTSLYAVHYANAVENQISDTIEIVRNKLDKEIPDITAAVVWVEHSTPELKIVLNDFLAEIKIILELPAQIDEGLLDEAEYLGDLAGQLGDVIAGYEHHLRVLKQQTQDDLLFISMLIIMGGILFNIFTLIVMRGIVLRPLRQAISLAKDLAQGDLTHSIKIDRKDEFGDLLEWLNHSVKKLNDVISEVALATTEIKQSSSELSTITVENSDGVNRQQKETTLVATAINELLASASEMSNNANETSKVTDKSKEQAEIGKQKIMLVIKSIDNLSDDISNVTDIIYALNEKSETIGEVVQVISEIADQTNLLALNAAIEAARAGEQGRGFAVVADEVRSLATRTRQSTEDIQKNINELQLRSNESVEIMKQNKDRVLEAVEQATHAGDELQIITESFSKIAMMNQQTATATVEQRVVAEEINKNIHSISDIADHNLENGKKTAVASDSLNNLTSRLQIMVDKFKI